MKKLVSLIMLALLSQSAWAVEKTVTLSIKNMTCAMCPITVKKSLQKVKGVNNVVVSFKQKTATVTYEDEITSEKALISAPTNVGYPASIKKSNEVKK